MSRHQALADETIPPPASYEIYHRTVGRKLYELTDHIGNVRAVIGDVKEPLGGDEYGVQLKSVQNYYPYGMPRPNNVWSAGALTQSDPYHFGFQGMQRDGDVGNATTAPSTTPFRQYDARLARWWSVDPLSAMTGKTYQALGGNPISMVDPWGLQDGTPLTPGSTSGGFWGMIGQGLGKVWNVVGSYVAGLAGDVMGGGSAAKAGDAQKPANTTQTSKQPETKKAAEKKSKGQDRGAAEVASAFGRGFVEGIKGRAEGLWNFAVGWAKSGQTPEQYVGTHLVMMIAIEYHKTPEQRRRDMPVNIPGLGRIPWVTNGDVENTVRTAGEINQAEGSQAAWEYVAGEVGKKTGEATFDIAVTVATEGAGRVVGAAGRAGSAAGEVAGSVADDVVTSGGRTAAAKATEDVITDMSVNDLTPTQWITKSRSEMKNFVRQIADDGAVHEPVSYVEVDGSHYIVDGHHRYYAAKKLGITTLPVREVQLPFRGYQTSASFFDYLNGRQPGWWMHYKP